MKFTVNEIHDRYNTLFWQTLKQDTPYVPIGLYSTIRPEHRFYYPGDDVLSGPIDPQLVGKKERDVVNRNLKDLDDIKQWVGIVVFIKAGAKKPGSLNPFHSEPLPLP